MKLVLITLALFMGVLAMTTEGSDVPEPSEAVPKPTTTFSDCTCTCSAFQADDSNKSRQKRQTQENEDEEEDDESRTPTAGAKKQRGGGYRQRYAQNVQTNSGAGGYGAASTGAYGRGGVNKQHSTGSGHQLVHSNKNTIHGPKFYG